MTEAVSLNSPRPISASAGKTALNAAARLWFAAAVIGQGMFLFYIARFYGPSTLTGNFQAWRLNKMLIKGYVAGDTAGNLAFGAHVLMAAVVTLGGTLQLLPQIRARAPAVHRWTGRLFLATAMAASLAGLYLTWVRRTSTGLSAIAISLDAVLILAFAAMAWRLALRRDFARHRRWAMRTFMVANGVWFLRVGFAPLALVTKALGGELSMANPLFTFWNFGCYLVPLVVLELYFHAKEKAGAGGRFAMAGGLFIAAAVMSVGIVGAWTGFFGPVLAKL